MTDEEKRLLQERLEYLFPKEYEQSKMPFHYHEKRQALIVAPYALKDAIQYAEEHGIDSIELSGDEIDLSPLDGNDSIHALCLTGKLKNVDAIYGLPLTHLHLDNSENKAPIDLSLCTRLESLSLVKKRKNISGLSQCYSLREICLSNYSAAQRNLSELSDLGNLCQATLTHAKIDDLSGVENLHSLRKLVLGYSRTLNCIQALSIGEVVHSLTHLEIDHCPNIATYCPIGSLDKLETLVVRGCKSMDSRSFVSSLNHLKHVYISKDTRILDEN